MTAIFSPTIVRVGSKIGQVFGVDPHQGDLSCSQGSRIEVERHAGRWRVTITIKNEIDSGYPEAEAALVIDVYDDFRTRGALYYKDRFAITNNVEHVRGSDMTMKRGRELVNESADVFKKHIDGLLDTYASSQSILVQSVRAPGGLRERLQKELVEPYRDIDIYVPGILRGAEPQLLVPRAAANISHTSSLLSFGMRSIGKTLGRLSTNVADRIESKTHVAHTIGGKGDSISFSFLRTPVGSRLRIETIHPTDKPNVRCVDSIVLRISPTGRLVGAPDAKHHQQGIGIDGLVGDVRNGKDAGRRIASPLARDLEEHGMEFLEGIDDASMALRAAEALMAVHAVLNSPHDFFGGPVQERADSERARAFMAGQNPFAAFAAMKSREVSPPKVAADPRLDFG